MPIYKANEIELNVIEAGPTDGPFLIFLHGFPEFSYGWRNQIEHFAQAGFHVFAPDQRGYNLSAKPAGVHNYAMSKLMTDVVELISELTKKYGKKKVFLVGHDWGAAVAWSLATFYPQILDRLVILNVPHPGVMKKSMNFRQLLKSWYMIFFQIPFLPEFLMRQSGYRMLFGSLIQTSNPKTFSRTEIEQYIQAWKQPGALTAMINWYRALRVKEILPKAHQTIPIPVLILWGKKDAFLSSYLADLSLKKCQNGKLVYFEDATHWVQHEKPAEINQAIEDFICR